MTVREAHSNSLFQDPDPDAQRHIAKVQAEHDEQYRALRRRAQSLFSALKGRTGVSTPEEMERIFQKAQMDFESGAFLIERLGTSRFLDPELTSVLVRLHTELLAVIPQPTAADRMHVNMAVLAYRNCLRIQNLINNCLLETERQLFGQLSLSDVVGGAEANEVARQLEDVERRLIPLLERCQRMMNRALDRLNQEGSSSTRVTVGFAGQVNVKGG